MHLKIMLIALIFTLVGCGSSDESTAPTVKINAPTSALSLEQLTFTANVSLSEGDTSSLHWQLSSDAGESIELNDVALFDYTVPLTLVDTTYTLSLTATDTSNNTSTTSVNFTVPAVEVTYTLPFDAISQRYIDVVADVNNIASAQIDYTYYSDATVKTENDGETITTYNQQGMELTWEFIDGSYLVTTTYDEHGTHEIELSDALSATSPHSRSFSFIVEIKVSICEA